MSLRLSLALLSACCCFAPAHADTPVYAHSGLDGPGIEGWLAEPGPASEGAVLVGPYNDPLGSTPVMVINDLDTAGGTTWGYTGAITPAMLGVAESVGWTLRARVRVWDPSDDPDRAVSVEVATGTRRFALILGSDGAENAVVRLWNGAGTGGPQIDLGAPGYHLYELVYDPATQTVDLFVDGLERLSDQSGFNDGGPARVAWGSLSDPADGAGLWNLVEWTVATDCSNGVLDPAESCDDGNLEPGDGCGTDCILEPGWSCSADFLFCSEICNDGLIVGAETCEDGNVTGGDGCGPTCEDEDTGTVVGQASFDSTALAGLYPSGERVGWDLTSLGDLDGDGNVDLAAAAARHTWYYDTDGVTPIYRWYLGSVWILFMDGQGGVLSSQRITEGEGGFAGTLVDWDQLGYTTDAIGDLDGDGVVDLLVSAHGDDTAATDAGAVYVLFLNADGTVRAQQKITTGVGGFDAPLDANDGFGIGASVIGDVDGDGVTDLAVGAYQDDELGFVAGAVYILFLRDDGTVRDHTRISYAPTGQVVGDTSSHKNFGRELAAIGDLDGDGIPDLAAGIPFESDQGTQRGAVWILFLNADGTVRDRQRINDAVGGFGGTLQDNDFFGFAVDRMGDIDGDGVTDLAVGATYADTGGYGRGETWILFLNNDGTVKGEQRIAHGRGGFIGPLEDNDLFGEGMAAGDFDGDGAVELAVGAIGGGNGFFMGEIWTLDLIAAPIVCGDGALDPGERCDDGDLTGGDGCSARCRREETLTLHGFAEGGSLTVAVDGIEITVATAPGSTPGDVAAQVAAALAAEPALAGLIVSASGDSIDADGAIRLTGSTDPGLADCAPVNAPSLTGPAVNSCPDPTVTLSTGSYTGYRWLVDGESVPGAGGSEYVVSLPGDYRVTVTDASGCKATTNAATVTLQFCATTEVSPAGALHPLRIDRSVVSPSGYAVTFQESAGALGYNLYTGTVGGWYDHGDPGDNACDAPTRTAAGGVVEIDLPLPAGDGYYLVSAFDAANEGPAGHDGSRAPIPPAEQTCLP